MKKWIMLLLVFTQKLGAQDIRQLTLEEACRLARNNYPAIKEKELVAKTTRLTIENINKAFLPQLAVNGQATYQSEVTKVDVSLPGLEINPLSKDQYKILADINQLIYDGGIAKAQKNVQQVNAVVEDQKVEVELYNVRERINQIFLGALLLDEQYKQSDLLKQDIELGLNRVKAQVENGTAFRSNQLVLEAELLKTDQRAVEIKAGRKGLVDVLALFIGKELPEEVELVKPAVTVFIPDQELQRPEMRLFNFRDSLLSVQEKLVGAKNRPKASLFFQGGYGKPGLNFLKNGFDWYYTTGIRLSWSLGGLYTSKREREILNIDKRTVDVQKETFVLKTNTNLKQQQSEVDKYRQLLYSDQKILDIRAQVTASAKAQLENGVITANDYLREVNAEDLARLTYITHQLQLLQAQINYQTIKGY